MNERQAAPGLLESLSALEGSPEVLWVDGGSRDGTVEWLRARGCTVIDAPTGRGQQLGAGARAARGDVLWFVHADSHVPPCALRSIGHAVAAGHRAGAFRLRFQDGGWSGAWMTFFYARLRRCGLLYGDAGIFVRRRDYEAAGGFPDWPLFEDQGLLRRLRRAGCPPPVCLDATISSSARRFAGWRFPLVFMKWVALQVLFWMGVPPQQLARAYPQRRASSRPASQ